MPRLPSTYKTFIITVKNYAESAIEDFCSFPNSLDFFILFQNIFSKPFWFLKYALREWESIAFFQKRDKKMIDKRTKSMFK